MAGKTITFKIWAANMVNRGVLAATRSLEGLKKVAGSVSAAGRAMGSAWGWVRTQFLKVAAGVAVAAAALAYSVKKAFEFERYEVQFQILFKSLAKAKAHMADLQKFAASTPFELPDIIAASRSLHVFTQGVMGGAASLRLIGDAASATGRDLSEVSMWVGRAYSMIKGGKPFGEASLRLLEMGVLTAEGRTRMEELQASGASAADVFGVLRGELSRFAGGMDMASKTGEGMLSTLQDSVAQVARDFGQAFAVDAKNAIGSLIEWLDKLSTNGVITAWAEKAREALSTAAEVAKALVGGEGRSEALGALADIIMGALKTGAAAAAELLVKYAPVIGRLIGDAAKNSIGGNWRRAGVMSDVGGELREKGLVGRKSKLTRETQTKLLNQAVDARLAEMEEQAGNDAAKKVAGTAGMSGREQLDRGLATLGGIGDRGRAEADAAANAGAPDEARLQAVKDLQAKAVAPGATEAQISAFTDGLMDAIETVPEGVRPKFEAIRKAYLEDLELKRKVDEDLTKSEIENVKKLKGEVGAMVKSDKFAAQAYAKAKQDAVDHGKDMNAASTWDGISGSVKEGAIDLKNKAAEDAKAQAEDHERRGLALGERQDALKLGMMSDADQKKVHENRAKDLAGKIATEKDPEKKMGLREKLQDELEALASAAKGAQGKTRQSIGLGDVFERMYGETGGKQDPAEKTAANTKSMLDLLKKIEGKGGFSG